MSLPISHSTLRHSHLLAGALLFCALTSVPAVASPETVRQAQAALAQGQASEAAALLAPRYASGQADNQTLFLLAMSAKQQGDWAASEKYLTELLQREPTAARAKLELAEVYYRSGQPDKAKQLLREVQATNPPPKVGENIAAFLAFIESGAPKAWSAYASVGLMYDTNANQGPDIDNVLIYNLPFVLDKDARGNHDWARLYRFGAGYTHALSNDFALQAGIHLNYTDYQRINGFDTLNLSLSAGPSWARSNWTFSLPYVFNTVRIGHDQRYYMTSQGVAPQAGYQLSPRLLVQGTLAWQDRRYKDNRPRNGKALIFSPSLRYALDNSSHLSLGGHVGRETSGIETSRNRTQGIELGYFKAFSRRLNLHLSPAWSRTDYDGTEAAYQKDRKDRRTDLTASLNYLIEPWNSNLSLSFSATDNRSSIEMYRYKRQQTMVSLTKYF